MQEVQNKIEAEQRREQEAIGEMHPRIRERITKQAPTPLSQTAGKPSTSTPNKTPAAAQSFSAGAWKKANPTGNVGAAKAEAKKRGYAVVD